MKTRIIFIFTIAFLLLQNINAQMVLVFNTNLSNGSAITLPLYGDVNVNIDWGDGNYDSYTTEGDKYHTYIIDGEYTVVITGTLGHFGDDGSYPTYENADKLKKVTNWTGLGLYDLSYAFYGANHLIQVPDNLPVSVTTTIGMFQGASSFNYDIGGWDVSNVTDMGNMFTSCNTFNQNIGYWNVANVIDMSGMFFNAYQFNQDIGNWDVSSVMDMSSMFIGANAFNQNIGYWNVSNVQNMSRMFESADSFNQNIENWDVGSVANMEWMFRDADSFNKSLDNWNTSNVTSMRGMFYWSDSFNGIISSWDVGNVTDMFYMFYDASTFNQDIGNWNVSNVTNMREMFYNADAFNQDIGNWNVSSVTEMHGMFNYADAFNQDIGNWNVSNVTDIGFMFYKTVNFDQNLGNWDISNVTYMDFMFKYVTLSTSNYDAILIGWSEQNFQPNITFHGGYSQYSCNGEFARNILLGSPNNWTITDGGFDPIALDEIPPQIISTHNDQTVYANANCEASLADYTTDLSAIDYCDTSLDVIQNPSAGTMIFGTTNQVTLTVTDDAGNTDEVTFNVAVEDNTDPIISSTHNDQTIDANANCEASLPDYTSDVTAIDNCDTNLDVTQSPTAGTTISGITNQVILTVTDDTGNYDNVSFNVEIKDNTNPTITCVSNQERDADETHTYIVSGTEFDPTETNDNCSIATIENDFNSTSTLSGVSIPEGTTQITWTLTDDSGNTNNCSFDVLVNAYVGIESNKQKGVSIYPNPTCGIIKFEFANNHIKKIAIFDIIGKQLIEKESIQQNERIDLSNFENGIYIISIQTDKKIITSKIVKR